MTEEELVAFKVDHDAVTEYIKRRRVQGVNSMKYKVYYALERYPVCCDECPAYKPHCHLASYGYHQEVYPDCRLGFMANQDTRGFDVRHKIWPECRIKETDRVKLFGEVDVWE